LPNRPQEVAHWGREHGPMPSIMNVPQFELDWVSWWRSCQPKWRPTNEWPYPRDDAEDRDWTRLNVTGPHGLFAIIVSTSWWAASMDSEFDRTLFNAAIEDLHWVLERLICSHSQPRAARLESDLASDAGQVERAPGKRKVKPTAKAHYKN